MQELVGRLTALDPEASESLKVVSYFDALVGGQVSVDVLARSAAVLAGCPAGVLLADGRSSRMSPGGDRMPAVDPRSWSSHEVGDGELVWIERTGTAHANDAMLLERFAIAVAITHSRAAGDSGAHRAVEIVVDGSVSAEDRVAAAAKLRLDGAQRVRAVARPATTTAGSRPTAVMSTPFGLARVTIISADAPWNLTSPAGLGVSVLPNQLPASWTSALIALRLSDVRTPVVDAERLGSMLMLAEAADSLSEPHSDVVSLDRIGHDRTALPTLDALTDEGSVRAAAVALGVHHSTVQARLTTLVDALGYDPRTADGRTRYALARMLQRLRTTRIG